MLSAYRTLLHRISDYTTVVYMQCITNTEFYSKLRKKKTSRSVNVREVFGDESPPGNIISYFPLELL